jgi:hypothetical protein
MLFFSSSLVFACTSIFFSGEIYLVASMGSPPPHLPLSSSRRPWVSPLAILPPILFLLPPLFVYFCLFSISKFIRLFSLASSCLFFIYLQRCAFRAFRLAFLFSLKFSFFLTSKPFRPSWRPPIFHLPLSPPFFCRTWIHLIQPPFCSAISQR